MKTLEFFYDYGSPASYLAWTQIAALCARAGARLERRPFLLGGLFKATGNQSPVMIPAKGRWMMGDLERHAADYGVPFVLPAGFPQNTMALMRGACWAREAGVLEAYDAAMFNALWRDGRDLTAPEAQAELLQAAGLDAAAYAAAIQDPAVKQALIEATAQAAERGAFGAPTFFIGAQMHFGQDRLDWVERALAA